MTTATEPQSTDRNQAARQNWQRYEYGRNRGHRDYCRQAKINEGMYLGGGLQWDQNDVEKLRESGRPAFEFNQILGRINTAIGYQIHNRMDIAFRPRGGDADQARATTLSKLIMQVADNNKLHWTETQVFADGLIQQRGYYDIRVTYKDSLLGEIQITDLDPLDVVPDPDAKSYDPDGWSDVTIAKWLTYDEIEENYGTEARSEVELEKPDDSDYGEDADDEERNKFGNDDTGFADRMGTTQLSDGSRRVRVIERQFWKMVKRKVAITLTGDIRPIDDLSEEQTAALKGVVITDRRMRRVRWVVSTQCTTLHDDWSPYNHFTVVPYFPFFRRGKTRGLVDNAIGPQQMLNKSLSQFLHIINTTANSGWISWADTIANMREEDIEDRGAETGLNMVLKKETPTDKVPRKIQPNQVPTGVDRMIDRASGLVDETTGINDAMAGGQGREVSGIAIQTKQFAAQQGLAVPLDNLGRTRALLASRALELIQGFYDEPRIVRITETDSNGKEQTQPLYLNYPANDGTVLNDLTLGEYDVVITEVPLQVTFENSQFLQLIEMLDKGIRIPPQFVVRHSNLADKTEILEAMEQQGQPPVDPLTEAKVKLTEAQTQKTVNEAVNKSVESQFSAIQTAGTISVNPATSALADALLRSAGYVDQDMAPIVPSYNGPGIDGGLPTNTNPLTPANPGVGLKAGIETPRIEGAAA